MISQCEKSNPNTYDVEHDMTGESLSNFCHIICLKS